MIIFRTRTVKLSEFWSVKSGESRFMNPSSNNVMQKLRNSCFFVIWLICRPHVARFSKISTNHFWLLHHQISAIRHFNHFQLSKKFKFKMIKSPITLDERIFKKRFPKSDVLTFQNCNFFDSWNRRKDHLVYIPDEDIDTKRIFEKVERRNEFLMGFLSSKLTFSSRKCLEMNIVNKSDHRVNEE